jgi:hypothetical protein
MLWTIIAVAGPAELPHKTYDWRPVLVTSASYKQGVLTSEKTAQEMCEQAIKQLNISDRAICIRTE